MKLVLDLNKRNISGSRVKQARLENNMTQEVLTAKLEIESVCIDRASISKIERHKRVVTDYKLVTLAKVLKVSVNWLLGLEE